MQTTINQERLNRLNNLAIKAGSHQEPPKNTTPEAACAMELVGWLADEPWSDKPACACPVIAAFVRRFNDGIATDARRTELLNPILPALIGSKASEDVEVKRGFIALDWMCREAMPMWLETVPELKEHAIALRALEPMLDVERTELARATVMAAKRASASASAASASAYAYAAYAYAYAAAYAYAYAYAAYAYAYAYAAAYASASAYASAYAYAYAASLRPVLEAVEVSAVAMIRRMLEVT